MGVFRRDGRVAEGAPLLRAYRFTPIEGSNPSLSATLSALSRCVLQVVDSPRTNPIIRAPRRCALVAQLDRVPGCEPGGRRFESSRARHSFPQDPQGNPESRTKIESTKTHKIN